MLQSLDTLIAFIVIMTIVSLFVTIIVQMVSTALSLRGKNLANALALTFQTIDPALTASAHQLAAKILSDPLLSDSTLTVKDRGKHDAPTRTKPWSAFTLWFNKAVKLATAVRPEEVYGALKKLAAGYEMKSLATIAAEKAVTEAQKALSAASTTGEKTAALEAAVTDAETKLEDCRKADSEFDADLVAKQDKVKAAQKKVADTADENAKMTAQQELKIAQEELRPVQQKFDDFCATSLTGTARKLLAGLGAPTDKDSAVADKLSAFRQLTIPTDLQSKFDKAMQDTSAQLVGIIDTERDKFEAWFSSAQDRAQQWFQLHTRMVTICASIFIAFIFQLDAVEIFHYVSTNSAERAALVASADKVVKEADGTLDEKGSLIKRINGAWVGKPDRLTPAELADVVHTGQLQEKLSAKAKATSTPFDAAAFNKIVDQTTKDYYKDQSDKIAELTRGVSATGFELIPAGFWRWPARKTESETPTPTASAGGSKIAVSPIPKTNSPAPATQDGAQKTVESPSPNPRQEPSAPDNAARPADQAAATASLTPKPAEGKMAPIDDCQSLKNIGPHVFGIFLFAALLTLGAPYWYNLLKNLTSLRPALTQLIGKEETAQTQASAQTQAKK